MRQPRKTIGSRNALVEFWFCVQEFLRVRRRFAKAEGLEAREYELLLFLKAQAAHRSVNVSLVAENLFVHHHVAATMVKHLGEKGFVVSERSAFDGRSLSLCLTGAGESLLERIVARSLEGLASEGPEMISSLDKIIGDERRIPPSAS